MLNSSLPFCGKYAILEYHADMVESVVAMEIANRDSGWEKKVDYMQGGFWMARGALLNNAYLLFFGGINVYTGSIIANVHAAAFTHNASVVQLEVGAHTAFADFDGGFIAPIKLSSVAWFSSFEPAMPRIQIAPGKVVDFKHSLICPRASAEVRDIGQVADGTHKVSSVAEMQDEFCKYY